MMTMYNGAASAENYLAIFQKFKHRVHKWPNNSTSKYVSKRTEDMFTQKLIAALLMKAKSGNKSNVYQLMNV